MKRWHLVAIGMLSGAGTTGVVAYAFSRPIIELFGHSVFVSAASQGALDVAVLRKLRSGDEAGAIETMEYRLAGNEITLTEYANSTRPTEREPVVVAAMARIYEYRKQYPSPMPPNKSFERTREE
jgi:hypothetical protein